MSELSLPSLPFLPGRGACDYMAIVSVVQLLRLKCAPIWSVVYSDKLEVMKRTVPVDKPRYSISNWRCWTKTNVAHQVINIGVSCGDIAGLNWQKFALGLFTRCLFEQAYHLKKFNRFIIADIINAPRRTA